MVSENKKLVDGLKGAVCSGELLLVLLLTFSLGLSGCVEFKKKDADESSDQSQMSETADGALLLSGRVELSEDNLKEFRAHTEMNRSLSYWVVDAEKINFAPHTIVTTNGRNIVFRAQSIDFGPNTYIQTFREGASAPDGKDGRSGGHIYFSANKASGNLTIALRGENGGKGLPGLPPDEKLAGSKGQDGKDGDCQVIAYKNYVNVGPSDCNWPQPGLPGTNGKQGYPGGNGGNGGDAGEVTLNLADPSLLNYEVATNQPGLGGDGGIGGQGGTEGPNGKNGVMSTDGLTEAARSACSNPSRDNYCHGVVDSQGNWQIPGHWPISANPGPQGLPGQRGNDGKPGVISTSPVP